jgi:hypothetical protein
MGRTENADNKGKQVRIVTLAATMGWPNIGDLLTSPIDF